MASQIEDEKDCPYRRERIMARMRGQSLPTLELMRGFAESLTKSAVEVVECPKEHRFVLRFTGAQGMPPHVNDLREVIEQFKPAHLGFGFTYTNTTHTELGAFTHDQLSVMTHGQNER